MLRLFRERAQSLRQPSVAFRRVTLLCCVLAGAWTAAVLDVAAEGSRSKGSHSKGSDSKESMFESLSGADIQEKWRGYRSESWPKGWEVEEGVVVRKSKGDDLMTVEEFTDFELRLEWKISSAGNSGIMYRVRTGDKAPYWSGPEFQILDDVHHPDNKDNKTLSGSLYGMYARSADVVHPAGEWNTTRILVEGNHVQHWLNGTKIVDCEIGSKDWNDRIAQCKFADWPQYAQSKSGHIALQDHGDPVWFRNIRIRRLGTKSP